MNRIDWNILKKPASAVRQAAFTLVELMTVMVIILLLIGIGVVAYNAAFVLGEKAVAEQMFKSIGIGLTGYANDFKNAFPPSKGDGGTHQNKGDRWFGEWKQDWNGGEILAQALLGPQTERLDGYKGYGFKFEGGGRAYGPYIDLRSESSVLARFDNNGDGYPTEGTEFYTTDQRPNAYVLAVPAGGRKTPILYFLKGPARRSGDKGTWDYLWSRGGQFDTDHNKDLIKSTNEPVLGRKYKGNGEEVATEYPKEVQENLRHELNKGDYMVVWSGPDGSFGQTLSEDKTGTQEAELKWSKDDLFMTGPR